MQWSFKFALPYCLYMYNEWPTRCESPDIEWSTRCESYENEGHTRCESRDTINIARTFSKFIVTYLPAKSTRLTVEVLVIL